MKVYLVGGAVRDGLLGLPVHERDWVVVGATPAEMIAQGYTQADPDFPVFLHPRSGEEYALARRETKDGSGYRGFTVYAGTDVTLEQDLCRRDLTVNAMARGDDDELVDPYGGRDDLDAGVLRHVSPAFIEDPLRVLRVARFAAKLGALGFRVAHGTLRLMRDMVAQGEMAHLSPERLWREMNRAMRTAQPWRFFEVLHRCGALEVLIPRLAIAMGEVKSHLENGDSAPIAALKRAARQVDDASARLVATFAACVGSVDAADELVAALHLDRKTARLLRRVVAASHTIAAAREADEAALVELLRVWRGFDAGDDIDMEIAVADALYRTPRLGELMSAVLVPVRGISAEQLREQGISGAELGVRLTDARRKVVHRALREAGMLDKG